MNTDSVGKSATARLLLLSAAVFSIAAGQAFAQTPTAGPATKTDDAVKLEKFEVTGSYLPLSGSVQASPVVTIARESVGMSGATDTLRLLKQLTPFFSGNGNVGTELNNGGAGESNVALRNLTTLVLLNGRRMVSSPVSNGTAVDLNTIPTAMIERVEILKDSASTIYGSDAIGGVVNIILRKNYNGFEVGGRYGFTGNGDYKTREIYLSGGVATDSGSIMIGAQHFENTPLGTLARPLTTLSPAGFAALGTAPGGIPASMSGSFSGRVGSNILAGSPLAVGAPGYNASITNPGVKTNPNAAPQTLAQLTAAGKYVLISDTTLGKAVGSATILNTTLFNNPLIVPTKRNEFVASGNKDLIGKNLETFGDFLYSQTTNGGSGLAPSPIAGLGAAGGNTLTIPGNNPYNLFGVTLGVGAPAGAPSVRNRLEELGSRKSQNETNTYRFVGGLRGEINDKYSWQLSYTYARATAVQRILGGANGANMNQLMIPLIDNGGYVYDSAGRPLSVLTDSSGNNLPVYNFFALPGFNAASTLDAIRTTLFQTSAASLRVIDFVVRGKPVELPAGDLSFALGAEGRTEDISSSVDALFANGLALGYNPATTFSGGNRSNKAAFLEVNAPITSAKQNIPGLYAVDLTAAVRYEKIQPGGNSTTPKFGVRWLPVDDSLALRATWSKGFIAPSIFSLFGPPVGNSPSYTIREGDGSSGSGGSTGKVVTGQYGSANELSNPLAKPSKSESYTVGVVYSPKQIKGLSFSMDYYSIKQDKVGSIDYTSVYTDLNAKGAGSKYASGFVFADNTKLVGNAANQITSTNVGTLTIFADPSGDQKTDGVDLAVEYVVNTNSLGRFKLAASASVLFNYKFRATQKDVYNQYARNFTDSANGLGGANGLLPSYILKPSISHTYGAFSTSLFLNYIPKVNAPGLLFGGASPTNTQRIDGKAYTIPSYFTADLAVSYTLPSFGKSWLRNMTLTAGANNVFDKEAPYVPGGGNGSSENNTAKSAYDIIGRFMFVEFKKAF
jgi:iron complex outermembrane receptor protein